MVNRDLRRRDLRTNSSDEKDAKRVYIILFAILGVIAVFCIWKLYVIYFVQYGASAAAYREVREAALEEEGLRAAALMREDPPETPEELDVQGAVVTGGSSGPPSVDFSVLLELDQNVVGWLSVPAIDLEYPVMQYKDDVAYKAEHGEEYYLNRTLGGEPMYAGSIFMDSQSLASLEDPSTVIFGHNIKNGMMFGRLKELKEQAAVDANPCFWIVRKDGIALCYRIFSVHETDPKSDTYTLFRHNGKNFLNWAKKEAERSIIKAEVELTSASKIVVLSTCTDDSAHRLVVLGVLEETVWP